jgi:hypothetical protein
MAEEDRGAALIVFLSLPGPPGVTGQHFPVS